VQGTCDGGDQLVVPGRRDELGSLWFRNVRHLASMAGEV
jgi:hypothetical protein